MSEMEKFAVELAQKKSQQEQLSQESTNQYQLWIESLASLHKDMEKWLQPLISSGVACVASTTVRKSEHPNAEMAGSYDAPVLSVTINGKELKIDSVGRYVVGSQGAVRIKGVSKEVVLVRLIEGGVDQWKIRTRANGGQSTKLHELNSDNFAKLLQDFLR
ncbi:hypothetical protein ACLUTX_04440 [Enterobacterales bacterium AE_CKDN230030158-1A_HGKHYDSX7]